MESAALPRAIGPYRVTGRLGHGGMGEVLQGYDERLDRPVALKRIRPDGKDAEKARQRFRREARAVAQLRHPGIVQIYDWVEEGAQDWLVMELVDGRSLEAVLAGGPLAPEQAASVARQVASGLAAAHEAGLVHRDLKPANVMVTARGVRILDFGIAKKTATQTSDANKDESLKTVTEAGQLVGTVSSMSPEQALGWPVDHRSDLFSLGTLLYEMLSGVSPFKGNSAVETLTRICSAKETPLSELEPDLPEALTRLVAQLLEKEPARRPPDARSVATQLDQLSNEAGSQTPWAALQVTDHDETLVVDTLSEPLVEKEPSLAPTAAEDSSTYTGPRLTRHWPLLVATGLLLAIALWVWSLFPNKAEPAVDRARDATGLSSHQLFQRGMEHLERYDRQGNIEKAIADFQRALAKEENYAPAYAGLARAYWLDTNNESNDPIRLEHALAAAQKAVEHDEFLADAWVSLGLVHIDTGNLEDAVRELERALQIEPLNADGWYGLGRVSEAQGQMPRAEEHYQRALEIRPNWVFYSRLGRMYYRSGRYQEAEKAFSSSLELAPDNYLGYRNLGAIYYMQGKLAEAATQIQQALRIQPEPSVYTSLGTIYFAQGLYAESVSAFEKAIEAGGSNFYTAWANLGDAYRWTPDNAPRAREAFQRAIQLLNEKLSAQPESSTLRTQLALYSAKLGECEQVPAETSVIQDLIGEDIMGWSRLAVANEVCRRRESALAALEVALQGGFSISSIRGDPELLELRKDVRYHHLIMDIAPQD